MFVLDVNKLKEVAFAVELSTTILLFEFLINNAKYKTTAKIIIVIRIDAITIKLRRHIRVSGIFIRIFWEFIVHFLKLSSYFN